MWKKEKMLVTSIFSFFCNFFKRFFSTGTSKVVIMRYTINYQTTKLSSCTNWKHLQMKKLIPLPHNHHFFLFEWCFTLLSTVFQSYHSDSSHCSCLSWVSIVLGWGSEVSCPRTLPIKNPKDPVWLEPFPTVFSKAFFPRVLKSLNWMVNSFKADTIQSSYVTASG